MYNDTHFGGLINISLVPQWSTSHHMPTALQMFKRLHSLVSFHNMKGNTDIESPYSLPDLDSHFIGHFKQHLSIITVSSYHSLLPQY